jgi:hypothetical protein
LTSSYGACSSFAATYSSSSGRRGQPAQLGADLAHVRGGVGDVSGAGLALGPDHRRALVDAAQRLTEVGGTADEGNREVHAQGLQDLGLDDCGLSRERLVAPVPYPTACSPQAWAATTPIQLIKSLMGYHADVAVGGLWMDPVIPESYGDLTPNQPLPSLSLS